MASEHQASTPLSDPPQTPQSVQQDLEPELVKTCQVYLTGNSDAQTGTPELEIDSTRQCGEMDHIESQSPILH